jgi:ribose 5-phosphate isomerase B
MCHDTYSAHQGVEHDDMNVCVLGARIIGSSLAYEVVDKFVAAQFIANEERFQRRFKKVMAIEAKYMCGDGSSSPA